MLWSICQAEFFPRNLRLRSNITRLRYKQALDVFGKFLGHVPDLTDLDDDNLTPFLVWLVDHRGICERSANTMVGRIRTLWTFLAKRGVVTKFPTSQNLPVPELTPMAWSPEQLRDLFDAASRMKGRVDPFKASAWWPVWLAWLWTTGERLSASLALDWSMVDLDRKVAALPASIRKGKKKPAVYHLSDDLVLLLRTIQRPDGRVFPWHRTLGTYWNHYSRLLAIAGLPSGRKRKTHAIRVSHATWSEAIQAGSATKRLMHGSPATTQASYLDRRFLPDDSPQLFKPWE